MDYAPKHKLESPANQGANKRTKFSPDTEAITENETIAKVGIVASPEFWNSDIRIVENVLSYLNYPVPLLKGELLRKAREQFNKVPVEIKIEDQVLRKPLDEVSDREFAHISSFLNPGLTVKYGIYKNEKIQAVWDDEAVMAAMQDREPYYLPLIMELLEAKLIEIEAKKWNEILTNFPRKEGQKNIRFHQMHLRHNYALLASMYTCLETIWTVSQSAALINFDTENWGYSRVAATETANAAALLPAWGIGMKAIVSAAKPPIESAASGVSKDLALKPAKEAAIHAIRYDFARLHPYYQSNQLIMGSLAYRIAEKTSLFYFIEHFDSWFEGIHEAIIAKKPSEIKNKNISGLNGIFSPDEWKAFAEEQFGQYRSEPRIGIFNEPWIKLIDKRVKEISS